MDTWTHSQLSECFRLGCEEINRFQYQRGVRKIKHLCETPASTIFSKLTSLEQQFTTFQTTYVQNILAHELSSKLPTSNNFQLVAHSKYIPLRCIFPAEHTRQDYGGGLSGPSLGSISNCIVWTSDWSPCSHSCGPGVSTRTTNRNWACRLQTETRLCQIRPCRTLQLGLPRLQPVST